MRALITGAAGFIGTNVTQRLIQDGHDVVAIDSLSRHGSEANRVYLENTFGSKYRFFRREIEEIPALIYVEKPDVVMHFAAQVAVTTSIESPVRDFKINAEGSFHIARAAADIGAAIIYTSTNKVFGDNVNLIETVELRSRYDFAGDYAGRGISETFSIDARHHTPYGVSKLVGELYVREFGGIANRCSCMYGPKQFGIVDQGWLSHIATNKILGRPTIIYGDGKQVRDIVHVDDVVDLFTKQAHALLGSRRESLRGHVFNVGGGIDNTISLLELCDRWGISPEFAPWRPSDQRVFYCDIRKARDWFAWEPHISIDDGLDDLVAWTEHSLSEISGQPICGTVADKVTV